MTDVTQALDIAEKTLSLARSADQAQVSVSMSTTAYARFARNYVTQNLNQLQRNVTLTYEKGKHLGTASTEVPSDAGLRGLVATAAEIAQRVPANPEFVSFPHKQAIEPAGKSVYASTAAATPADRVAKLLPVFDRMRQAGLNGAGYTMTERSTRVVANSLGVRAVYEETLSGIEIKAMARSTSGYASFFTRDYASLDSAERAGLAVQKASLSNSPQDFQPGTYTVILEAPAFLDCISAVYDGLNVESVLEDKDSWMVGRSGKLIFSPNLTIVDDWSNPLLANAPFGDDGAPTKKLTLVDRGMPREYVSSTYFANKYKVTNTGHSFDYPVNAIVLPGSKSREELIASTERGILISRTWYLATVDPREVVITGLTRDGVFLIENGKLTKALKNFRFNTSMLDALQDAEFSNRLQLVQGAETGLLAAPDAKLRRFHLSAQTSFA